MGAKDLKNTLVPASLVIFTCENREHLLSKTFQSFSAACDYKFQKVILAIDGKIDQSVISQINPDVIIQYNQRRGYAHSISKTLKIIDTPYFFWLEDDWVFHREFNDDYFFNTLANHSDWAEIVFSKDGPLNPESKINLLENNLYKSILGFSANPCFCNTRHLQWAFKLLEESPKGDKLGEDGFENFLTRTFEAENIKCVIIDPVDHLSISHEGYLESTPRNWHMTNSLETKTSNHLLTIPAPSLWRKLFMIVKLFVAFFKLSIDQLSSNKIYELCFRIIASAKTIKKNE
jgi:hypothetical protein